MLICLAIRLSATDLRVSDSKSSSGTQSSRPYNHGQFGSTSTLPSSADADSNDNIFAIPRPHPSHFNSSPNSLSLGTNKKELPSLPKSNTMVYGEPNSPPGFGRVRAMTSSSYASYASTAKAPKLDDDMNFGSTSFDDLFSGLDRKEAPAPMYDSPGRSILAEKRTVQPEPIRTDHKLEVEAPLTSWESRGSNENLISSSPEDESPPPVPLHNHSKYAPVASYSPEMDRKNSFDFGEDKHLERTTTARKSGHESSPERLPVSQTSSYAQSLETPLSSRSASNNTTPKAALRGVAVPTNDEDDDNIFAPPKQRPASPPKPAAPTPKQVRPPPSANGQRVMSQAQFHEYQQKKKVEKHDPSSDEEDYEDEEEAVEKAQQEAIARRRAQKMDMARASMIRSTTAPTRPDSVAEPMTGGFPSEVSMNADEWEDEDIPLGILAQHGFPSRNRPPTQPANAMPSYFPGEPMIPERPASAGALGNRQSQAFRPAFARRLPDDPFGGSVIGGGLVRPSIRESMGFANRGPTSIAGGSVAGDSLAGRGMGFPEPQMSAPSLVDQIHMRDMSKQKYMGGASSKKPVQEGPFTGLLGSQMNGPSRNNPQTRMSMMGGMNGMPGANGMAPMMNNMGSMNMMGSPMGMPMMGMNPGMGGMGYMTPEMMQMQQQMQQNQALFMQQQQMQMAQMQAMQQQGAQPGVNPRMSMAQDPRMSMAQDPRMSMAQDPRMSMIQDPRMSMVQDPRMSMANFGNSFLNVPGMSQQRPMSVQQQGRPYSTGQMGGLQPTAAAGYSASIAPSERSNIGLSARYRPVATHQDAKSTVSHNTTLQASSGATVGSQNTVKGILKHKPAPALAPRNEEEDEAWGKIASRKKKYGSSSKNEQDLRELTHGLDRL
jgi:hypothetical protein